MNILLSKIKHNIYRNYFIFILFINLFVLLYHHKGRSCNIIAISYANYKYKKHIEMNQKSALEVGKVDKYYYYSEEDIDQNFKDKNIHILFEERGNGYWLWKPYFILKTLKEKLNEGDFLIYSDAGVLYTNKLYKVINNLLRNKIDIWLYELDYKEKIYSKRDAFILMQADNSNFTETFQYMATLQIYRKSNLSEKFVKDLLFYCQDKRINSDEPNTMGFPNYEGFIENRHDQTIASILYKKYGILNSLKKRIVMPITFCVFRRVEFKDYNDLKKKCSGEIVEMH